MAIKRVLNSAIVLAIILVIGNLLFPLLVKDLFAALLNLIPRANISSLGALGIIFLIMNILFPAVLLEIYALAYNMYPSKERAIKMCIFYTIFATPIFIYFAFLHQFTEHVNPSTKVALFFAAIIWSLLLNFISIGGHAYWADFSKAHKFNYKKRLDAHKLNIAEYPTVL